MNCQQYKAELTSVKTLEELSDAAKQHLSSCSQCKALSQSYNHFLQFADAEKKIEVSPFIATRIMAAIETDNAEQVPAIIPWLRVIAVTLTMTIGFTFAYLSDKRQTVMADLLLTDYFDVENNAFEIETAWFEETTQSENNIN
ncbi:hypothetical protein ACT3CD_00520 [Geofilum sp. OHC36d9]|uniref:hypothetical protein n=1 Tax=Geofilum sp. OHC36d9 TaxID=3458413 RepID=UPI004034CC2B